jgi:hypothetical protein
MSQLDLGQLKAKVEGFIFELIDKSCARPEGGRL